MQARVVYLPEYLKDDPGRVWAGWLKARRLPGYKVARRKFHHDLLRDPFPGACPFHGDCLEGLAAGPAIQKRLGRPGKDLSDDDPFWMLEAHYLALAVESFILMYSPRKVILGGGIMQRPFLFDLIRPEVRQLLNGYVQSTVLLDHLDEYIVPPGLGTRSGILGAIALAASGA